MLGLRLREIRKDAGLTGRALATAIGCHFTKVSLGTIPQVTPRGTFAQVGFWMYDNSRGLW
jgi:transcriptional regulator with XRE-family HTH domain